MVLERLARTCKTLHSVALNEPEPFRTAIPLPAFARALEMLGCCSKLKTLCVTINTNTLIEMPL